MACNGVLTPPPSKTNPPPNCYPPHAPVLKFLNAPHPQTFYSPLRLELAASAFFTHGHFQQAYVHISGAITTD